MKYRGFFGLLRFRKRGDCGEEVFDVFTHECVPEVSVVGPLSDGHCYEKRGLAKYSWKSVVMNY